MKGEIKTPVVVAAIVAVVAVAGVLLFKAMGSGDLDSGQVKYTPGVPPWLDKQNGGNGKYQPVGNGEQAGAPANQQAGVPPSGQGGANLPPGMTAPSVGNK